MKFYYENNLGDKGCFTEDNLVKAIYTAWNIEADLYVCEGDNFQIIFSPHDDNEFNSELLEPYGYKMIDGEKYRDILEIKTDKIIRYDWDEVKQLI